MKKLFILIVALIMAFAMVSCGDKDDSGSESASSGDMISVTIDIDYPDGAEAADVDDAQLEVADGSSVLDALKTYADTNDIELVIEDSSDMTYVSAIGGVAETDTAGWVYEVNDEMAMDASDKHAVKKGAKIDWSFESWADDDGDNNDDNDND